MILSGRCLYLLPVLLAALNGCAWGFVRYQKPFGVRTIYVSPIQDKGASETRLVFYRQLVPRLRAVGFGLQEKPDQAQAQLDIQIWDKPFLPANVPPGATAAVFTSGVRAKVTLRRRTQNAPVLFEQHFEAQTSVQNAQFDSAFGELATEAQRRRAVVLACRQLADDIAQALLDSGNLAAIFAAPAT